MGDVVKMPARSVSCPHCDVTFSLESGRLDVVIGRELERLLREHVAEEHPGASTLATQCDHHQKP